MRRTLWTLAGVIWIWLWSGSAAAAPLLAPFDPPWPELRLTIEPPIPIQDAPRLPSIDLPLPRDPPDGIRPIWSAPVLPIPPRPEPKGEPPGRFACVFTAGAQGLLTCGKARVTQGEWAPALDYFERALKARPEPPVSAEAWFWKGEVLVKLGRAPEAHRAFAMSVLAAPRGDLSPLARMALGWLDLEARRGDEALREFEGLLTLPLDEGLGVYARFGRAAARVLTGQVQSAISEWEALLERSSLPPALREHTLLWLAEGSRQAGELGRAAAAYERFVTGAPTHPLADGAILQLGRLHLERGAPLEALKSFRWLVAAFPESSHLPRAGAGILLASLQLGDRAESHQALQNLMTVYSSSRTVLPTLVQAGRLALDRGEPGLAGEIYEALGAHVSAGAIRAFATFMRAESLGRARNAEEARRLFAEVRDTGTPTDLALHAAYRLAQLAFGSQNDTEARREVAQLLPRAVDPSLKEASLFLLGQAAYWLRDYGEAISADNRLLQEFPDGSVGGPARFVLGWAQLRLNRTEDALRTWQRLIERAPRDPRRPEALLLSASLRRGRGDPRQAAKLLEELVRDHPEVPQVSLALYLRGLALLEANDPVSAVEAFRAVVTRDPLFPHLPTLRLALGQGLLAHGKYDEAFSEFRVTATLLSGQPLEAEAWLGAGIAALRVSRFADAEVAFQRARLAPRQVIVQEADYGLALLADHRGDREAFTQVVLSYSEKFPRLSLAGDLLYLQVGRFVEAGEIERAQVVALRLIRLQPQSEHADDALFRIGQAGQAKAAHTLVRDALSLLVERYPESPYRTDARFGAAEAHGTLKEFARAQAQYEAFLGEADSQDPRRPRALLGLALARERGGERIGARRAYEELLRSFPTHAAAAEGAVSFGQLLIREREWNTAQTVLTRAIERGTPERAAEATYWLGELHRDAGRPLEATDGYLSVVYLYPGQGAWVVKALLAAGELYRSAQQTREAVIVYRKLLARSDLPEAVAKSAQEALTQLESSQAGRR